MAIFEVMANLVVTNVGTPSIVVEVDDDIVLGAVKVVHDEGPEMKCCTGPKNLTNLGMLKTRWRMRTVGGRNKKNQTDLVHLREETSSKMDAIFENNTQDSTSKVRQCFKDEEYDGHLFQKGTSSYEG